MKSLHTLKKSTIALLFGTALLTACGDEKAQVASTNIGGDDGVFTIAYAPNESTPASADARKGLAKDLEKYLGCKVEEIQSTDYNAIVESLRTGKAEMAYMGSQALALGRSRTKIEPIAMKAANGIKENAIYHSVFITQSDNHAINSLADFAGKTIAFVDPGSTSGNLVPTAEIINQLADLKLTSDALHTNKKFFEAVSFSGSHQAGLQAVIKGDVDIVPISDQILASEIEHGNATKDSVKIVYESAPIPAECVVVAEQVSEENKKKLQDFLVKYDNEDYFSNVIKLPKSRFVEASMADYEKIIELNKIINEL